MLIVLYVILGLVVLFGIDWLIMRIFHVFTPISRLLRHLFPLYVVHEWADVTDHYVRKVIDERMDKLNGAIIDIQNHLEFQEDELYPLKRRIAYQCDLRNDKFNPATKGTAFILSMIRSALVTDYVNALYDNISNLVAKPWLIKRCVREFMYGDDIEFISVINFLSFDIYRRVFLSGDTINEEVLKNCIGDPNIVETIMIIYNDESASDKIINELQNSDHLVNAKDLLNIVKQ